MTPEAPRRRSPSWFLPLWVSLASAALLAGGMFPLPTELSWRAGIGLDWYDPDSYPIRSLLLKGVPVLTGALALLTLRMPRRLHGSLILAVAATAALAAYTATELLLPDAFALLGYGVLAISFLTARRPLPGRSKFVSALGYLLLAFLPVVLLSTLPCSHHPLKFWLLATGHTILLATGLAAWLEERLSAEASMSTTGS